MIIGIDEVGYGPIAGPLVAMAVAGVEYLPQNIKSALDDSKKLTASKREYLNGFLLENKNIIWGRAVMAVAEIEKNNILRTAHLAMVQAGGEVVKKISVGEHLLLVDGNKLPQEWIAEKTPARAVVGGDGLYASIAAASIMAKVYRDGLMVDYDQQYPDYGFGKHKGYGTAHHVAMVKKFGPCPIHRPSFLQKILSSPHVDASS